MTMTVELLEKGLPANMRTAVSQELVDMLNTVSQKPEEASIIRENFLGYTAVLQEGRYKMADYLNAVKYCSYKMMGHSNEGSYIRTFPDRYQRLKAAGTSPKDIGAYVHAYSRNKMVVRILEQAVVPAYILNQDIFQEAINVQASIMRDTDASFKVRSDAANSLLTHLAKPKEVVAQNQINFDMRESSGTAEMRKLLQDMALQSQQLVSQGVPVKELAAQKIVFNERGEEE